jgi:hypothetical protein
VHELLSEQCASATESSIYTSTAAVEVVVHVQTLVCQAM